VKITDFAFPRKFPLYSSICVKKFLAKINFRDIFHENSKTKILVSALIIVPLLLHDILFKKFVFRCQHKFIRIRDSYSTGILYTCTGIHWRISVFLSSIFYYDFWMKAVFMSPPFEFCGTVPDYPLYFELFIKFVVLRNLNKI
jgi:hypothetical protein